MHYQPWLTERIDRYRRFMDHPQPGMILTNAALYCMPAAQNPDRRPLSEWDFETQWLEFTDAAIDHYRRRQLPLLQTINDDQVPQLSPGLGIAVHSAYYSGADVTFGPDTSWVHPVIHQWDDLDRIAPDPEQPWFKRLTGMSRRFVDQCDGEYAVQTFSHLGPGDMANALRGNDLFLDFYDTPEQVHRLMEISLNGIVWMERALRQIVPDVDGGSAIWGTWVPGRKTFLSEDVPDLCSPEIYREFFQPYTNRLSAETGGVWIHHHAAGYAVHADIAAVDDLACLEISWDPNKPRPVDRLGELFDIHAGLPLMTRCTPQDVYDKIDLMKQGPLILMLDAPSPEEARDAVAFIRRNTTPLA